jgi:hypothetical protein
VELELELELLLLEFLRTMLLRMMLLADSGCLWLDAAACFSLAPAPMPRPCLPTPPSFPYASLFSFFFSLHIYTIVTV